MIESRSCWIIGAGGHAKVVIDALLSAGGSFSGVLDSDPHKIGMLFSGKIVNALSDASSLPDGDAAHIAIGSNSARETLSNSLNLKFRTILHERAWTSPTAKFGAGVFVGANAVVQADANLGEHTIVNTAAIVEHDCVVGPFVHIAPGAVLGGNARVGTGTLIGTGACVLPNIGVGGHCRVGAGAVITKDVPDGSTIVGIPGRTRKEA